MLISGALVATAWILTSFPVAVVVGRMFAAGHPPARVIPGDVVPRCRGGSA